MLLGQRTLIVEIDSWQLSHTLFPEESLKTGRIITLSGTTETAHFLYTREAGIEIWEASTNIDYKTKANDDGENYIEYGQIGRYESDTENNIDAHIYGAIGLNINLFDKVLFLIKELTTIEVWLKLKLYGLDLSIASIECDKWQDNKLLSITGVEFLANQTKSL